MLWDRSYTGVKEYRYYRCSRYTAEAHLSVRVTESDLDVQTLEMFLRLKIGGDADVALVRVGLALKQIDVFQACTTAVGKLSPTLRSSAFGGGALRRATISFAGL